MLHRFFSESPSAEGSVQIAGAEAHHLLHVLRLGVGDEVMLFDGRGDEFRASIANVSRQEVECIIEERSAADRELAFDLTLGVALPKGDRQRWLVEKAVELGVTQIIPLRCDRSVVRGSDRPSERLQRAVIEASKQCGRNRLAEIAPAADFVDWVDRTPVGGLRLFAHPAASKPIQDLLVYNVLTKVDIAIGPEGGFSQEEFALARTAGWHPVNLGPRLLRVETAALAALSAVALKNP